MPSVKIPRKSTVVDMTPFVDVAFLILTFFIMATKFKPPEPVEVTTPSSVSSDALPESDAVMVTIDKEGKVYFTVFSEKDPGVLDHLMKSISDTKGLNLSNAEIVTFRKTPMVGVPFSQLKSFLQIPAEEQKNVKQPGIPIDSTGGELTYWIQASKKAFAGRRLKYLIKGDNDSKYPVFKSVIDALRRNEEFKYNLVTAPEDAPSGTELYKQRKGIK
ncbi:MAG: biopolymer transporter ExbD [Chitinophagaceae bacterium]